MIIQSQSICRIVCFFRSQSSRINRTWLCLLTPARRRLLQIHTRFLSISSYKEGNYIYLSEFCWSRSFADSLRIASSQRAIMARIGQGIELRTFGLEKGPGQTILTSADKKLDMFLRLFGCKIWGTLFDSGTSYVLKSSRSQLRYPVTKGMLPVWNVMAPTSGLTLQLNLIRDRHAMQWSWN